MPAIICPFAGMACSYICYFNACWNNLMVGA
jgi:hypothetical protein